MGDCKTAVRIWLVARKADETKKIDLYGKVRVLGDNISELLEWFENIHKTVPASIALPLQSVPDPLYVLTLGTLHSQK